MGPACIEKKIKKDLRALTLVGPSRDNPKLDP